MSSLPNLRIRLDAEDRDEIVTAVASRLLGRLRPLFEQADGVRVVSPSRLARELGQSRKSLYRLEMSGDLPLRRRIGRRQTGYLVHELDDIPAVEAVAIGRQSMNRDQVAKKLDVAVRTVDRLREDRSLDFPQPIDGLWLVRELDQWLIERPKVEPASRRS